MTDAVSALHHDDSDQLPIADSRAVCRHLWAQLRRHPLIAVGACVTTIISAAASLIAVLALGYIIDALRDGSDRSILITVAIIVAIAAVVTAVMTAASETLLATVIARVLASLREQVVAAVLGLPISRIERAGRGDTLSRVGTDVAVLVAGSRTAIPAIFSSSVLIVVSVAGLFRLDWRLALAGLTAVPAYAAALRWYLPRSGPKYIAQRSAEATHVERLVTGIDGITTVRAYGVEQPQRDGINAAARSVRDISISAFGVLARFVARENRAEWIGLSIIVVVGWSLLRIDAVSLGQVAAATLLFHRLFNPIGSILNLFDEAQRSGAALRRIVGVISTGTAATSPSDNSVVDDAVTVSVRELTYRYSASAAPAITNVEVTIPAGTSLALVGASGAGKTTLASVIAGTLRPTESSFGTVSYNEHKLADLDDDEVRRFASVATQESHIFAGTLAQDLRMAAPDAGDDDLWAALDRVGARAWALTLPQQLGTPIGIDGYTVDPMKAQQIALARLILRDTPVVVLDESTAEAGSRGADVLEAAAAAAIAGRTALIVAHRLSQAAAADAIAVVSDGAIVEYGSHATLLATGGQYAQLWQAWSRSAATDDSAQGIAEDYLADDARRDALGVRR